MNSFMCLTISKSTKFPFNELIYIKILTFSRRQWVICSVVLAENPMDEELCGLQSMGSAQSLR